VDVARGVEGRDLIAAVWYIKALRCVKQGEESLRLAGTRKKKRKKRREVDDTRLLANHHKKERREKGEKSVSLSTKREGKINSKRLKRRPFLQGNP